VLSVWIWGDTRLGITLGILLLVAALAAVAVAVGGGEWGSAGGERPDLSTRLALGALGGAFAGPTSALAAWLSVRLGLQGLFGVGIGSPTALEWQRLPLYGALWGLGFGLLYTRLPGSSAVVRALWFSTLPGTYLLLVTYPFGQEVGLLGLRLGLLTPIFVLAFAGIGALAAGGVMAWGERTDFAPLDAPLCE